MGRGRHPRYGPLAVENFFASAPKRHPAEATTLRSHCSGCLREGAKSYAKVKHVLRRRRGCCTPVRWRGPSRPARATGPFGPTYL